jgi:hypothetical protein
MLSQHGQARLGDLVVATAWPAIARLPVGLEGAVCLEGMERRIEGSLAREDGAAAPLPDPLGDFVSVQLAVSEHGQDQQRRSALEELSPNPALHMSVPTSNGGISDHEVVADLSSREGVSRTGTPGGCRAGSTAQSKEVVEMGESRTPRPETFSGDHYERVR